MGYTNKVDEYVAFINKNILTFIDYEKLQDSYETDMKYAKGILNSLHKAMVMVYGGEIMDENNSDEGFVVIPGIICGGDDKRICLALLDVDISSSGEHWGTSFICKYGIISQNPNNSLTPEMTEFKAAHMPYHYCYTAVIPNDIHIDTNTLPKKLQAILKDFKNYNLELHGDEPNNRSTDGIVEFHISDREFEEKIKELMPNASDKSIKGLIEYAELLKKEDLDSKENFLSKSYVAFNLAVQKYGCKNAVEVLNVFEEPRFNAWEIPEAVRLIANGKTINEVINKADNGELYLSEEQKTEIEAGYEALKNGTLTVPTSPENMDSVIKKLSSSKKTAKKPQKKTPAKKRGGEYEFF